MKYLDNIQNALTGSVSRQALKFQKVSPNVLFVGGVVGVVATTVLACRATLKLTDVLDEAEADRAVNETLFTQDSISEKQYDATAKHIYIRSSLGVVKLYAPSVLVGVASVAALTGSHKMLTNRNAALTAAYAALDRGFREYRARVVEDLGEDKDREFRFGSEKIKDVVEGTNGPKKVEKVVAQLTEDGRSIYARMFDETNINWQPHPDYNAIFLRAKQNYFNDRLWAKKHVLLNDVYEELGMERTKEGCIIGWAITGDSHDGIDFGCFMGDGLKLRDFSNRFGTIWLDFNVDGVVYDKI